MDRIELDATSWVDVVRGFLADPDPVYEDLARTVPWRASRLWRYERWVEEPRVGAAFRLDTGYPHPALVQTQRVLEHRYRVHFDGVGLAWYRDGRDGQAFHRDRDLRFCEETVIGILSLGARRPWLLRRRGDPRRFADDRAGRHDLAPAGGDLIVMGGRCQADWEHSVPVVRARPDAGRISAQWRWTSRRGRPEIGASYRAPRHYTRS